MTRPENQPSVSTEAQRQALDAMSEDLVRKLDTMVKEQEQRVRTFIRTQHSSSALPGVTPNLPPTAHPTQQNLHHRQTAPAAIHRNLPPPPATTYHRPEYNAAPLPTPQEDEVPDTPPQQEEGSIGVGTILTFVIAVVLLMRACS